MNHFANNGKEYLRMKENNKYRQGRSKEQIKASYIGAFISIVGLVVIAICLLVFR
jgi:hypothetical protein